MRPLSKVVSNDRNERSLLTEALSFGLLCYRGIVN